MDFASNPLLKTPIIPYALIFIVFYFLVLKPQKDKQKEQAAMKNNLQKNDSIITTGGIHGIVANIKEKTVMVRVDDGTKIEFDKEAIASVVTKNK